MYVGSRLKRAWKSGRRHLKSLPSSRTGENPPYGMIGGSRKRRHHSKPGPRLDPTRPGSLGIDTVSRPSSRNSWSEGARVHQNSRLKFPHTPGSSQGVCGLSRSSCDLAVHVGGRVRGRLHEASGTTGTEEAAAADGRTILGVSLHVCDNLVGQLVQVGRVEETATHAVEFRIDQFTHYSHHFSPLGF